MDKIEWGGTPGPWEADGPPCNVIVWSSPTDRVCFMAHSDGREPEKDQMNARAIALVPELVMAMHQYRSDLRHPPVGDSVQRRLERVDKLLAIIEGVGT